MKQFIFDTFIKPIEGCDDDQVLNLFVSCHMSGHTSRVRVTAGELRTEIKAAFAKSDTPDQIVIMPCESGDRDDIYPIDLAYHDYYSVEIVTDEVEARDQHQAKLDELFKEFEERGVPRSLLYDDHGERQNVSDLVQGAEIIHLILKERGDAI